MSKTHYIIYGKDNCANCVKAENILKMKGANFSKLMLDKDYSVNELTAVAGEPIRMLPYLVQLKDGELPVNLGAGEVGIKKLIDALRV